MARKSRRNVGVIGLGIIGSRVAAALRGSGFHVYVWNRSPRAAPNFLASPAEVAEVCDVIQIFVSDAQALFEVIDAFDEQIGERHTILCNATIGPEATIEAAKLVEERGAKFLDAPFTGSKVAAEKRELVYYVGGSEETLKNVEPVLRASSKQIVKIGEIGHAATIKVVTNMLAAVTVQTLAEALAIVKRSGIAPEMLIEALEPHGVRSGLADMKLPRMIQGNFEPHFAMKHMFKDVQLGIHVANSLDIDIPATTATAGVMYGGLNRGWADLDFCALAKVYSADGAREESSGEKAILAEKSEREPEPEKTDEPPKETLAHMMPPPPREELAATLQQAKTASPEPLSDEAKNAISDRSNEEPRLPTPPAPDRSAELESEKNSANETAAGDAKPAGPRLNRIRRWFVARVRDQIS